MYKQRSLLFRITALALILVVLSPVCFAEVQPRESSYISSYNAYPYSAGLGKVQFYFEIVGMEYLDEIGALSVMIYESTDGVSWEWKKTYEYDTTSGMLGSNAIYHSGHVDYYGVIGRYYKAYVTLWGGKDGGGDTRYMWTNYAEATLFAQ